MPINYNISGLKFHIPWFMMDLDNKQLIMSPLIPGDIKDTKGIVYAEQPIPGLNYQPYNYGGGGNRRIQFTIPLVKRNNTVGNVLLLKQFENLRNQATGFFGISGGQFEPNPQVLYYWGVGSLPQIYNVTKCEFNHRSGFINNFGYPTFSDIDIELMLDETALIYKAEEIFRKVSSMVGMAMNAYDVIESQVKNKRPI